MTRYFLLSLFAVLLPICSLASPVTKVGKSFSITHQQHNRAERMFDGAWALKKAYLRHGIPLPEHLEKRQTPQPVVNVASVPAQSENNDLEYLSPVEVGGVKMMLDFDTGSSDL